MSRPLDIVLELSLIAEAKRGIDYYIENVVNALAEVDSVNRYTLFAYFWKRHAEKAARLPAPANPNFRTRYVRFPESVVTAVDHRWGLPLVQRALLSGARPDVYHVLAGGRLPHVSGPKTVVTFFDLSDETWPKEGRPDPGRKISSPYTYELARRADRIVATGEYTKKDLLRYYALPEEKIEIITTGVNLERFAPVTDAGALGAVRARYRLPGRFFLVIGPYVPLMRNNADYILRAFARLKDGAAVDCHLVLTGTPSEPLEKLLVLAGELGVRERVHTPGYIAIEDLPAIYSLAEAVAHPTSVEGFGYGLEVLACGTPFLTSDRPGVVEAVGDAALTVPRQELEPLAAAMERLLTQPQLRRDLREKGLARAARFSYREIAKRLVALYERLVVVQ